MARTESGKHGHWLSTDHLQAWCLTDVDTVPLCARERTPIRAGEKREVCMDQLLQSWNTEKSVVCSLGKLDFRKSSDGILV